MIHHWTESILDNPLHLSIKSCKKETFFYKKKNKTNCHTRLNIFFNRQNLLKANQCKAHTIAETNKCVIYEPLKYDSTMNLYYVK